MKYLLFTLLIIQIHPVYAYGNEIEPLPPLIDIGRSETEYAIGNITMEQHCQNVAYSATSQTNSRQAGQAAYNQCLQKLRAEKKQSEALFQPYQETPQ